MKFRIVESINDKAIFKAVFLTGNPGAGKSYTLSKISDGSIMPRIVNSDKFGEHYGYSDNTKQLVRNSLKNYLNGMLPLFVDGTSSDISNVYSRKGILESLGYDTGMIFINTSLETSLERNEQRKRQVPEDFLKRAHERIEENKEYYKKTFGYFYEINNDIGELTDEVIINAYKSVKGFYNSNIQNPIGLRYYEEMISNNMKYLTDGIITDKELEKKLTIWYKQ